MWYLYSPESLPNMDLVKKGGYTPEFIMHAGVQLPPIEKGVWLEQPDNYYITRHKDWRDRPGSREHIASADMIKVIQARFAERGVIVLDHKPSTQEKEVAAELATELNLKFRTKCIDFYEAQRHEKEVTGQGRTKPTPYEDECYELLGLPKPYSVEAFRAIRQPGMEAADRIAAAITGALKADRAEVAAEKAAAAPVVKPAK